MRTVLLVAVVIVAVAGCGDFVISHVPLPNGFVDPSLTGFWCFETSDDGRCEELALVSPVGGVQKWVAPDGMASSTSSVLAGSLFLSWSEECAFDMPEAWDLASCDEQQKAILATGCARDEIEGCVCAPYEEEPQPWYFFAKYRVVDGELYAWLMDYYTVANAIDDGLIDGEAECSGPWAFEECHATVYSQADIEFLITRFGQDLWEPMWEDDDKHEPLAVRVKGQPSLPLDRVMGCITHIDPEVVAKALEIRSVLTGALEKMTAELATRYLGEPDAKLVGVSGMPLRYSWCNGPHCEAKYWPGWEGYKGLSDTESRETCTLQLNFDDQGKVEFFSHTAHSVPSALPCQVYAERLRPFFDDTLAKP